MPVSAEIIYYIIGACLILLVLILSLIRMSNGIISRKLQELYGKIDNDLSHRMGHLEKIARNHGRRLLEQEKKMIEAEKERELSQAREENRQLKQKIESLEKRIEKNEIIQSTQETVMKAVNRHKTGKG